VRVGLRAIEKVWELWTGTRTHKKVEQYLGRLAAVVESNLPGARFLARMKPGTAVWLQLLKLYDEMVITG